jgi:hypothetical protein
MIAVSARNEPLKSQDGARGAARLEYAGRPPRWRLGIRLLFALFVIGGLGFSLAATLALADYLFRGTVGDGIKSTLDVSCAAEAEDCRILRQDLGHGRWRVAVTGHHGLPVNITIAPARPDQRPGVLLLRAGFDRFTSAKPSALTVDVSGKHVELSAAANFRPGHRRLVVLDTTAQYPLRLETTLARPDANAPLVLDEIGLFDNSRDVNRPFGLFEIRPEHEPIVAQKAHLLAFTLLITFVISLSKARHASVLVALGCALAIIQASLFVLLLVAGPEWAADIRLMIAAGTLLEPPGSNLNYGMHMAHSVLSGAGPLVNGAPPWNRMPGYGILLALAGPGSDLLTIGVRSLAIHIGVLALGLGLLVPALARLVPLPMAAVAGIAIAVAPATPWYTFIETMMPGIACIVLAAGCYFAAEWEKRGSAPLIYHLILHGAFALWFSIRPDIVPAWVIVSLILYVPRPREWPKIAIPVVLFLAIGLSWALFKRQFTGEFNMTTNSFGASLMVGMWDAPHPFVWSVTDGAYFGWLKENGLGSELFSARGSAWAIAEVFRFMLVYPLHVVALVANEFMAFIWRENCPGYSLSPFLVAMIPLGDLIPNINYCGWTTLAALAVALTAAVVRYKPMRLLMTSSILFFNVPIFFLTYSSAGRFYNTAVPAMLVLLAAFCGDLGYWRALRARPFRAAAAVALILGIALFGERVATAMLTDRFRYSFSILDPTSSTLVRFARPLQLDKPVARPR